MCHMSELKSVLVVGAGTMGSQIALQTAMSGRYAVTLVDSAEGQLDRAGAQNKRLLDRAVEKGRTTQEAATQALARITPHDNLAAAAGSADLVIEAVIEDFDAKKGVFTVLGEHAKKDAILASNSSTIAISRLAGFTGRPERCCNMHFFHPVTVMQLCEVVRGPKTSDATDEAMHLLEGGYATAEDIDIAVQKGLNWPMGPFHLLDFSGLDIFYGAMKDRHRQGEGEDAPELLRKLVEDGHLGRKTGKGFFDYP